MHKVPLLTVLLPLIATPVLAFGPTAHMHTAEETFGELANLPGNRALRGNATAKRCYAWGAVFPDLRIVAREASRLRSLKKQVEDVPGVKQLRLDVQEIGAFGFDTHSPRLNLHVVQQARATGSAELLAFALGCLAHGSHDRDEQTFTMHRTALAGRAGDIGVGASVSRDASGHAVGTEVQLLNEAMREAGQSTQAMKRIKDAPRRLAGGGFLGYARSVALNARLKTFYYSAARAYALAQNPSASLVTSRGFMNCANWLEAGVVLVPGVFGRESLGKAARTFKSRYVDLKWWANVVYGLTEVLTRVFTLGTQGVLNLADLVLFFCKGGQLQKSPFFDVLEGAINGGRSWRRVEKRYENDPEFKRLVRSGMLKTASYPFPAIAKHIALDLSERGLASRWVDWPNINTHSLRGVAAQSFLTDPIPAAPKKPHWLAFWRQRKWRRAMDRWRRQHERGFAARAGGFMVADVTWRDAGSGQELPRLAPTDQGRRVRVDVQLQGLHARAAWLYRGQDLPFELVVVEDALRGVDAVVARRSLRVPASQVDPLQYGRIAPPLLSLDVAVPLGANSRGYHVELRYDGKRVFTTDWDQVVAKGATAPQYARNFGTYRAGGISSLPIQGR